MADGAAKLQIAAVFGYWFSVVAVLFFSQANSRSPSSGSKSTSTSLTKIVLSPADTKARRLRENPPLTGVTRRSKESTPSSTAAQCRALSVSNLLGLSEVSIWVIITLNIPTLLRDIIRRTYARSYNVSFLNYTPVSRRQNPSIATPRDTKLTQTKTTNFPKSNPSIKVPGIL